MLFLVSWTAAPECRNAAVERFLGTFGKPPEGVKIVGRWHAVGPVAGFALAEAAELQPIMLWISRWTDLFSISVHPAVNDEQLHQAIMRDKYSRPKQIQQTQAIEVSRDLLAGNAPWLRAAKRELPGR